MKILVTGGFGFIGSNFVNEVSNKHEVHIVDNMSNGHIEFVKRSKEDTKKINAFFSSFDDDFLIRKVEQGEYDCIVHFAALPRVSYSVAYPYETWSGNVTATMKLIEAYRRSSRGRFIFSSSSSVYGGASILPSPVNTVKDPKSPYALQKSVIEDVLKQYSNLYEKFDAVSLRYFNVFGPNQLGGSPYATAVANWLQSIYQGGQCRSDGDGTQTRDMCYVDNVISAVELALNREKPFTGQCYNVATGIAVSNNEILNYLHTRFGDKVSVINAPVRAGDVKHTLADISETMSDLSYVPKTYFWEGLERTIDWSFGENGFRNFVK